MDRLTLGHFLVVFEFLLLIRSVSHGLLIPHGMYIDRMNKEKKQQF